jgi:hypothetical protein
MSEASGAPPQANAPPAPTVSGTTSLGVVDPLRLPIPAGVARWWAGLPLIGRAFVGLAVLDVVGRAAGLLEPEFVVDLGQPILMLAQVLPRDLVILLPALILTRRRDAGAASPLVLRGATLIAIVELISPQLATYVGGIGPDTLLSWSIVAILTAGLKATGWIAIAIGLLALSPPQPSRTIAGIANLVAGGIAGMALLQLALALSGPRIEMFDADWNLYLQAASGFAVLESFALAFLARVVIRGAEDPRRPFVATRMAATAFGVIGTIAIIDLVLGLATLFRTTFGLGFIPGFGPTEALGVGYATIACGWFGSNLMTSAFLVAFGLGLADTSIRIPGSGSVPEPKANGDEPSWPVPGGEVPIWPQAGGTG